MIEKINKTLLNPLDNRSRLLIAIVSLGLVLSYFFPVWQFTLSAPQYPKGLELSVYLYKLEGGDNGNHVHEINILNHYIGMKPLDKEQLKDLDWIPFAIGLLILFGLRVALIGNLNGLLDLLMLSVYLTLFITGRFIYTLYILGHELSPEAPVNVEPFMPVIVGSKQIANFITYSYPMWGSLFFTVFILTAMVIFIRNLWAGMNRKIR